MLILGLKFKKYFKKLKIINSHDNYMTLNNVCMLR